MTFKDKVEIAKKRYQNYKNSVQSITTIFNVKDKSREYKVVYYQKQDKTRADYYYHDNIKTYINNENENWYIDRKNRISKRIPTNEIHKYIVPAYWFSAISDGLNVIVGSASGDITSSIEIGGNDCFKIEIGSYTTSDYYRLRSLWIERETLNVVREERIGMGQEILQREFFDYRNIYDDWYEPYDIKTTIDKNFFMQVKREKIELDNSLEDSLFDHNKILN
ncbi:hypothetical protein ACFLR5_00850 [Elusimicrobiota bacterium]